MHNLYAKAKKLQCMNYIRKTKNAAISDKLIARRPAISFTPASTSPNITQRQ